MKKIILLILLIILILFYGINIFISKKTPDLIILYADGVFGQLKKSFNHIEEEFSSPIVKINTGAWFKKNDITFDFFKEALIKNILPKLKFDLFAIENKDYLEELKAEKVNLISSSIKEKGALSFYKKDIFVKKIKKNISLFFFSIADSKKFKLDLLEIKHNLQKIKSKNAIKILMINSNIKNVKTAVLNLKSIDLIFWTYPNTFIKLKKGFKIQGIPIFNPGTDMETFGKLNIYFNKNGKIQNFENVTYNLIKEKYDYEKEVADINLIHYNKKENIEKEMTMLFFAKYGCDYCKAAKKILSILSKKYKNLKIIVLYENQKNIILQKYFEKQFNIDKNESLKTPFIVMGQDALNSNKINKNSLEFLLQKYNKIGSQNPLKNINKNKLTKIKSSFSSEFQKFSFFTIIFAGFLDGINPCAFVTILFLISLVNIKTPNPKTTLKIGLSYTLGCFIIYFLIGLGFSEIYKTQFFINYSSYFDKILASITFVFAILSFYDAYQFKKTGKSKDMTLQLPMSLKKYSHKVIRIFLNQKFLVLFSFLLGGILAIIEFPCTGQVYLPTLKVIINMKNSYFNSAIMYLFIYNVFFIIPLLFIVILAYKGVTSNRLNQWFKKKILLVKILTGMLFIFITIYLIF